jgi:hypothetical protein
MGWLDGSGARYVEFLSAVAASLSGLGERLGEPPSMLPERFNRPKMSPAQLADAYLWIMVTRRVELIRASSRRSARATEE